MKHLLSAGFRRVALGLTTLAASAQIAAAAPACVVAHDAGAWSVSSSTTESAKWGERVAYRAFDTTEHTLTIFPGVHVELLLPDSWIAALTDEELRRLVTRADLLYTTYRDLTGKEPWGFGRAQIAVVYTAGASGRGRLSFKGIEIDPENLSDFREQLRGDSAHWVLSHEMAHNFDNSSNLFRLGSDAPHAWTELVQFLALAYERSGAADREEAIDDALGRFVFVPQWLALPAYSFENCTAPGSTCGDARLNSMFGMMGLRTLQLHGLERAPQLLRFLTTLSARFGLPRDRWHAADIYIEGLAEAAQRDVSCYADVWKWHASPELRQRLAATYGPNPFCADTDGDGFTPLGGDVDDGDPTVHPLAPEMRDGRDNDGNGIIDDAYFADGVDLGFGSDLRITTPAILDGAIAAAGESDTFRFAVERGGRFIITVARRSAIQGQLQLSRIDGATQVPVTTTGLDWYGTTRVAPELSPGEYRIAIAGTTSGSYRLAIRAAKPWLRPWGSVLPPTIAGRAIGLTVETDVASLEKTPTHIALWVEGVGEIAKLPWSARVEHEWTRPAELHRVRYRARLLAGDDPLTGWSLPAEATTPSPRKRAVRR